MTLLVTGGAGFIGSHVVRALHDLGQRVLVVQRSTGEVPPQLSDLPVFVERGDVTDLDSLLAIGSRHDVSGIVHLAGYQAWLPTAELQPVPATRRAVNGLLNVIEAAQAWGVTRLGVASTIGVYAGVPQTGGLSEALPLFLSAPHPIPRSKKIGELLNEQLAETTGVEIINYRISGTWGPLGHADPFFAAPALVHAAARNAPLDLSGVMVPVHAEDALDLNYVKDTARAIAQLQLATGLSHAAYNIGSGRATTNTEIINALHQAAPDAVLDLPHGETVPSTFLDITRLRDDIGYAPAYDTVQAAADYVDWLRAGNAR